MPYTVGSRIGPYHITAKLGAGGMGEVWRAQDPRLRRDVALKVLPDAFARDPARLARVHREAQVLASLNHPGIAAIYGVEETADAPVLVLELVDGPTLAEEISFGAMSVTRAISIARMIAEAVEAAHNAGVVHRDLKPANIKVRPDDTVKVLDFGLARAVLGQTNEERSHDQTTIAGGVLIGTPAYMAPEQMRGEAVDRRADIWAFGCILYEMLAGVRAFEGSTTSDKIAAVLSADPRWDRLPPDTPPIVERLIRRCLRKPRRERLSHMEAVRMELEEALAPTVDDVRGLHTSLLHRRWWLAGLGGLAVALIALAAVVAWRPSPAPATVARSTINTGEPLYISSATFDVAISKDGRHVVYVAGTNQIYVRTIDQLEPRLILRGAGGVPLNAVFSPDGEWVAYFDTTRGALMKISIRGGQPVLLCPYRGLPRGASWGPDGIVFAASGLDEGLFRVSIDGGTAERLTTPPPGFEHWWPEILPGGNIVFALVPEATPEVQQIVATTPGAKMPKSLLPGTAPRYVPTTGHLLFNVRGELYAVRFDPERLEIRGEPVTLPEKVVSKSLGAADFSVSANGTLVYVPATATDSTQSVLTWVDRLGREQPLTDSRPFFQLSLSPDGQRAAALSIEPTNHDIWVYDLTTHAPTRLTFDPASDIGPLWTPDGTRIVFTSTRDGGHYNLFWKSAGGIGSEDRLTTSPHTQQAEAWSPLDRSLILTEQNPGTGYDLLTLPMTGDKQPKPFFVTQFNETLPAFSPNGKWLAYQSDETGKYEIHVRPFPDLQGGQFQVSVDGGQEPVWSAKGDELFFRSGQALMSVRVDTKNGFSNSRPEMVFQGSYLFGGPGRKYGVAPTGDRFLVIKASAPPTEVVLVQNWSRELAAQVP